jgi:hypothetical protein
MKPIKSIVLLTAGALAFGGCSKKVDDNHAKATDATTTTTTTDQGSGVHPGDYSTNEGSGAVSDSAATDELSHEDDHYQDTTRTGSGSSSQNVEKVDETSSEPDHVRGGRDPRIVPKNNDLDNTSSEPDPDQM